MRLQSKRLMANLSLFVVGLLQTNHGLYAQSHRFDLGIASGELRDSNGKALSSTNKELSKQVLLSYAFQLNPSFYLGVDVNDGETGSFSLGDNLFGNNRVEYRVLSLKTGYHYRANEKQSLYAELSLNRSEIDVSGKREPSAVINQGVSERATFNDTGWGLRSGWRYQLSNNIGLNIGLEHLQLNGELSIRNITAGLSFGF